MSQRMARINRTVRTALGQMVPSLIRDPRVHASELIVVQEVRTSPDLRHAKVYVSIRGDSAVRDAALRGLQQASSFLRRELGRRVRLRYTPDLRFLLDESGDVAARVDGILRELAWEGSMQEATLADVAARLNAAERLFVTTHPDPDGDAVGSMLAVLLALRRMGKTVVAYNPDPIPQRFQFLSGAELVQGDLPSDAVDVSVVLDCSDRRMFPNGVPDRSWLGHVVVLDHHKTVGDIADSIYRDQQAAATGIIVHQLLKELPVELDRPIAEALYCSILSDTGSFRYGNTNPQAMRVGAELLEVGVDAWHVASHLYETRPRRQLELLAMVLGTLRTSDDGLTAALMVTEKMLEDTGCTSDMVDGFINYARALQGVEVGILLRMQAKGLRVSLRSRGNVDVSVIAAGFGGGGHHNAAGFTAPLDPDQLLAQLFRRVASMNPSR